MGIGLLELVVIAVVALVLLGPQKLPEVLKQVGRFYVQLRRTSMEFKSVFDDVVRQAEEEARIDEIKRLTQLAKEQARIIESQANQVGSDISTHATHQDHHGQDQSLEHNHHHPMPPVTDPLSVGRSDLAVQVFDNPRPEMPSAASPTLTPAENAPPKDQPS